MHDKTAGVWRVQASGVFWGFQALCLAARGAAGRDVFRDGVGTSQWRREQGCVVDSIDAWGENDDAGHVSGASLACAVDSRVFVGKGRGGGSASGMAVILQWACPSPVFVAVASMSSRHFPPKDAHTGRDFLPEAPKQ
jgi:hypothetical protein